MLAPHGCLVALTACGSVALGVSGKASCNERRKAMGAIISPVLQPLISGRVDLARMALAGGGFLVLQTLLHYAPTRVED